MFLAHCCPGFHGIISTPYCRFPNFFTFRIFRNSIKMHSFRVRAITRSTTRHNTTRHRSHKTKYTIQKNPMKVQWFRWQRYERKTYKIFHKTQIHSSRYLARVSVVAYAKWMLSFNVSECKQSGPYELLSTVRLTAADKRITRCLFDEWKRVRKICPLARTHVER